MKAVRRFRWDKEFARLAGVLRSAPMLHLAAPGEDCSDALEQGRIVRFRECPVALPDAADQDFLRGGLAPFLRRKNVSYYPDADRVSGLRAPAEVTERAGAVLRRHSAVVRDFLQRS